MKSDRNEFLVCKNLVFFGLFKIWFSFLLLKDSIYKKILYIIVVMDSFLRVLKKVKYCFVLWKEDKECFKLNVFFF